MERTGSAAERLPIGPPTGLMTVPPVRFKAPATAKKPARPDMPAAEGALEVWTDGACSGNPGPGGWAWATRDGRQDSGGEPGTTNQRMEIKAALEALRALPGALVVVSDSTYVVNCIRQRWYANWLKNGWRNSQKKPVANVDLWEPMIELYLARRTEVGFEWVKGHSGNPMNDLVDSLAVAASFGPFDPPPPERPPAGQAGLFDA